jgi:hypothetical protein
MMNVRPSGYSGKWHVYKAVPVNWVAGCRYDIIGPTGEYRASTFTMWGAKRKIKKLKRFDVKGRLRYQEEA